ncbi:MAG: tRNA pseudouridine(55) synthase TruB [Pedosphaera sp.]|nr:tRNA pseudouridine(55) synthase TruB [Pedosphaera sp.]MSU43122.1 tRNA pseudouridine(55) synthase TruB [Pedosphaera sp.]
MRQPFAFDGALLVDKPAGPTSHDIVDSVRDLYRLQQVGHCGTLDPGATGLLVVLLGRATKLSSRFMTDDKTYEGVIKFGLTTDSYDAHGAVTSTAPVPEFSLETINAEAKLFTGDLMQKPPMISAVKKGGTPLYKLARKGQEVERDAKLIHVFQFDFLSYQTPEGRFRVSCTKGGYVRSLAHDLGARMGCGAILKNLHRTRSGRFNASEAIRLEALLQTPDAQLPELVIPLLDLVKRLQSA